MNIIETASTQPDSIIQVPSTKELIIPKFEVPSEWNEYEIRTDPKNYIQSLKPFLGKYNLQQSIKSKKAIKGSYRKEIHLDIDTEFVSRPEKNAEMLTFQAREINSNSVFLLNISQYDLPFMRDLENKISPLGTLFDCKDRIAAPRSVAGILTLTAGIYWSFKDIVGLFPNNSEIVQLIQQHCHQNRRITIDRQFLDLPYFLYLDKCEGKGWHRLRLKVKDMSALLGNKSLKDAAATVGIKMQNKETMDKYKTRMDVPLTGKGLDEGDDYQEHLKMFLEYAAGDCITSDIERQYKEKFLPSVYNCINLECPEQKNLHDTTGATVAQIVENFLHSKFKDCDEVKLNELIDKLCPGETNPNLNTLIRQLSVKELLNYDKESLALIGIAVNGGRCKNEQPTVFSIQDSIIADADIMGCYGKGLLNQSYPIGLPSIVSFGHNEKKITLGKCLKKYQKEFVDGLWQIIVTGNLSFDQDLIFSKTMDLKELRNKAKKAVINDDVEIDIPFGLFSREIINGTINHDILQALKFHASDKEWSEIKNLEVVALYYYPKSMQFDSIEEWMAHQEKYTKGITFKHIFKGEYIGGTIKKDLRSRGWVKINFAEMIEPLLDSRAKLKQIAKGKIEGIELANTTKELIAKLELDSVCPNGVIDKDFANALQDCLKLTINTIYGTLASPFFDIGNVVVASNITARARALAWMMKNGTNSQQSITDGSAYQINSVRFWGTPSIPSLSKLAQWAKGNSIEQDELNDAQRYPLKPLGNNGEWKLMKVDESGVEIQNDTETILGQSDKWNRIDTIYHEHLKALYSKNGAVLVDVLKQMGFEHKDLYKSLVTHSQSNYMFTTFDGKNKIKARGQKVDKEVVFSNSEYYENHPLEAIYKELGESGVAPVMDKFKTEEILKVNKANDLLRSQIPNKTQRHSLTAGDAIWKSTDITIISLSQFLFQSSKQKKAWLTTNDKFKKLLGWGIESYYYSKELGGINYKQALIDIQKAINQGDEWIEKVAKSGSNSRTVAKISETLPTRAEALEELGYYSKKNSIKQGRKIKDGFKGDIRDKEAIRRQQETDDNPSKVTLENFTHMEIDFTQFNASSKVSKEAPNNSPQATTNEELTLENFQPMDLDFSLF